MQTGKVKWFNDAKGYGFIVGNEVTGGDVFVHHSVIQMKGRRSLSPNQEVLFEYQETISGLQATKVIPQ